MAIEIDNVILSFSTEMVPLSEDCGHYHNLSIRTETRLDGNHSTTVTLVGVDRSILNEMIKDLEHLRDEMDRVDEEASTRQGIQNHV